MRKLKLDFNSLVVESFEAGAATGMGTVRGRDASEDGTCQSLYLYGADGCANGTQVPCGNGGGTDIWCQPTVAGTCHGSTCEGTCLVGCHDISREYPLVCGAISYPNCSARCTNIVGCTTPDMGC